MIQMRPTTGWESYSSEPASFMKEVLNLTLAPRSKARLMMLIRSDDRRMGFIYRGIEDIEDVATLVCAVALWRAATQRRHSILVGGRPSIIKGWHTHLCLILSQAASEIKRDFIIAGRNGLRCVNGTWVMRYDGPLLENYWDSVDDAPGADVIFGDLDWVDRDAIDEALDDSLEADTLCTMIVHAHD